MKSFIGRFAAFTIAIISFASVSHGANSNLAVTLSSPSVLQYNQQVTFAISGLPSHSSKNNNLIAFLACSATPDPWTDQSGSWYTYQLAASSVTASSVGMNSTAGKAQTHKSGRSQQLDVGMS